MRPARRLGGVAATVVAIGTATAVAITVTGSSDNGHPAAPPGPHPMFFGLTVPQADRTAQASLAREVGTRADMFGMFVKLDSTFSAADIRHRVGRGGMTPLVTLEPWSWRPMPGELDPKYSLTALIRGDHDPALTRIAAQLHSYGKPVYLRFAHEMNGHWYPWAEGVNGNRPGEYVTAWRHVHDIFAGQQATNVRWIWAPNVVQQLRPGAPRLPGLYPGDAYVDFVGLTGYGQEPTANATYDRTIAQLASITDKRVVLAEVGAAGATKTAWIRSFGPWLNSQPRVFAFNWFNTYPGSVPGATGDYRVDDRPDHVVAFRHMLTTAGLTDSPDLQH